MTRLHDAADISAVAAAIAAVSTAGFGIWQFKMAGSLQREAETVSGYDAYMRICIDRPQYGSFFVAQQHLKIPSPGRVWEAGTIESERYLWLVSYMLRIFERLLAVFPNDKEWLLAINTQLIFHEPLLRAYWGCKWEKQYTAALDKLVKEVIGKAANA